MNGTAAAEREVSAEVMEEAAEELLQRASPKGRRIATTVALVMSLALLFSPKAVVEPGVTAFGVVVAGAAAFCWEVYGQPLLHAASLHSE